MDRKQFISSCGLVCIGGTAALSLLLQSCAGTKMVNGILSEDHLVVSLDEFVRTGKNSQEFRKYIIVSHPKLQHPVCVYRFSESHYSALLMKCTHQGNELTAYGDKLQCAAHGSEFDKKGNVTSGPADKPLRTFAVTIENNQLKIALQRS